MCFFARSKLRISRISYKSTQGDCHLQVRLSNILDRACKLRYPPAPASHWANAAPFSTLSSVSQRSLMTQASLSQHWKASTLDWIPKSCKRINSYLVAHEGTNKLAIRTPDSKPPKFHLQPRSKAGQTPYNEFRNCCLQVPFSPRGHPPESWGTSAPFQLLSKYFEPQHPTK